MSVQDGFDLIGLKVYDVNVKAVECEIDTLQYAQLRAG
jgi:hypothetical protein